MLQACRNSRRLVPALRGTTTTCSCIPKRPRGGVNFSTASKSPKLERPRRSLFSVPGSDARKITKAQTLGADSIVLDLEDGVAPDKKDEARSLVNKTLIDTTKTFGTSEIAVRINGLDTRDVALRDLEAIAPCGRLDAVVVPKVEDASDVRFVSRVIDALSDRDDGDVRILAAIESARGVLNLREIAGADAKLDGLIFASEDYCADIEAIRTADATELLFARSQVVVTAKAYDLQAIDMVHIHYKDLEALEVECRRGRELGFTGKQAIHPCQIDTIHRNFAPSEKDIGFARRVVNSFEETVRLGKGACSVDGIMVDAPMYKWAVKVLKRAEAAGMAEI